MTELVTFGKIFAEDLARGRGTQQVTLADGTVATLHEIDLDANGMPSNLTWGYSSATDGSAILHGMGATPDAVIATGSVRGESVSVTAKDSTTFTVAISKNWKTDMGSSTVPNGTPQTIYWVAFKE